MNERQYNDNEADFDALYAENKNLHKQIQAWKEVATKLAIAIKVGNDHGYGLRIGDDATASYEKLKTE